MKNIPLGGALARTILPGGGRLGGAPRGKAAIWFVVYVRFGKNTKEKNIKQKFKTYLSVIS